MKQDKAAKSTRVAIFGIGEVGKTLAEVLLTHGYDIAIVSRTSSSNKNIVQLKGKGARAIDVDYSSERSVRKAVSGADIVISTLSGPAFAYQWSLAKAAKEERVKLFVPSMWGFDYTNERFKDPSRNPPLIEEKFSLLASLDEVGRLFQYMHRKIIEQTFLRTAQITVACLFQWTVYLLDVFSRARH